VEHLDLRSARPPFQFTNDGGGIETNSNNAASLYVEIGQHITLRNRRRLTSTLLNAVI
jgi:hypothetical protein